MPATQYGGKKRIIVCCDGTWMDSDGTVQTPSNVTRLARSIKSAGLDSDNNHIPQLIFYQNGLGSGSKSLYVKYVGGTTGDGLAEHIREAYSFIALNYEDGDEIFILGFSRGAFTARSIAALINEIGLLTPKGLQFFIQIFEDWEYQAKQGWKTRFPLDPFPGHKPPVKGSEYRQKLIDLKLTRPDIPIKAVAVWDTVGSLGIPLIGLLPQPPSKDFSFVDTKVSDNVEYAFQALALDERRRSFAPTIWEKPSGQRLPKVLKQCWFPGVHSDIGGSYPETDLSTITLCWMIDQLDPLLTFDHDYIWQDVMNGIEKDRKKGNARRPWGLGKIHNSMTSFFLLGGSITRTPGEYCAPEPSVQHGALWWIVRKVFYRIGRSFGFYKDTETRPLTDTNETIHSSVRIRMGKQGLGYDDQGLYDSSALKGWTMSGVKTNPDTSIAQDSPGRAGEVRSVVWKKRPAKSSSTLNGNNTSATNGNGSTDELEIPEASIGTFEHRLLSLWPEIEHDFYTILPVDHQQCVGPDKTIHHQGHSNWQNDHKGGDSNKTNGYTNGYTNGHTNVHTNGRTNGYSNGNTIVSERESYDNSRDAIVQRKTGRSDMV